VPRDGNPTILVVEDDPSLQQTVRKYLERLGFTVQTALDGESVVEILNERVPDLICLDLILPRRSGFEVCELVRRDLRLDVPILVMNGRRSALDRAQAYEAGADGYLLKPFLLEDLAREVERLLDGPRSSQPRSSARGGSSGAR
jgi:DNA-binding response OmpR family regulator